MNKISVKDSSLAFLFGSLLCQVSAGVFFILASAFLTLLGININTESIISNCWGYLLAAVFMNIALFLVFYFFKKKKEDTIISKPTIKKIFMYIAVAICLFICMSPIVNLLDVLLEKLNCKTSPIPYTFNLQGFLVSIVSLALIPAVVEELLFRGLIFKGLKGLGKTISIVISAVMFSLFHLSINQTIYPLISGLVLGGIMWKENNILYTIITHFTSNLLTLIFTYFNIWYVSTSWWFILVAILLFAILLAGILIKIIKGNKNTKTTPLSSQDKIYLFTCFGIIIILWIIINIVKFL